MKRAFPTACVCCRKKKIKCDGQFPCMQCSTKNLECEYQEPRKRGPKSGLLAKLKEENEKLRRCVEHLDKTGSDCSPPAFPFAPPKIEEKILPFSTSPSPTFGASASGLSEGSVGSCCSGKTLGNVLEIDLESHQTRLFLGVYFNFVNSVLPMVDEDKFRAMYSQLSSCTPQQFAAFSMQLYGMMAIVSRISCQPLQAEVFIGKARAAAKEFFDQPLEEVVSGLALIAYYNYGIGERSKAGCTVALAAQMCQLIKVSEPLLWACRILCLGNVDVAHLLPQPSSLANSGNLVDAASAQSEFFRRVLPASFKMCSKEGKMDAPLANQLLADLEEALKLQETFSLGGSMNFAYRIIITALQSWIYASLGDARRATESASAATLLTSNKFNIFLCPFIGGLCLQLAKFHLTHRQNVMFNMILQTLEQIADRWTYMREPFNRLRALLSPASAPSSLAPSPPTTDMLYHSPPQVESTSEEYAPCDNSCSSSLSSPPASSHPSAHVKQERLSDGLDLAYDANFFSSFLQETNSFLYQDLDASISHLIETTPWILETHSV